MLITYVYGNMQNKDIYTINTYAANYTCFV